MNAIYATVVYLHLVPSLTDTSLLPPKSSRGRRSISVSYTFEHGIHEKRFAFELIYFPRTVYGVYC
jgi:hypothetical protein